MSRPKSAHILARTVNPPSDPDDPPVSQIDEATLAPTEGINPEFLPTAEDHPVPSLREKPPKHPKDHTKGNQLIRGRKRAGTGPLQVHTGITEKRWQMLLQCAANGLTRANMLKQCKVSRETFDAYLITHVKALKQLQEADRIWLRRSWTIEEMEELFSLMCTGITVKSAAAKMGWSERKLASFYSLARSDKAIMERYDEARKIQAESWMDDNVDISDARGDDTFIDLKGVKRTDHKVIQRDDLRIRTRFQLMGTMNRKRFGKQSHLDVTGDITVNHAVELGKARKRLEKNRGKAVTVNSPTQEVVSEE